MTCLLKSTEIKSRNPRSIVDNDLGDSPQNQQQAVPLEVTQRPRQTKLRPRPDDAHLAGDRSGDRRSHGEVQMGRFLESTKKCQTIEVKLTIAGHPILTS